MSSSQPAPPGTRKAKRRGWRSLLLSGAPLLALLPLLAYSLLLLGEARGPGPGQREVALRREAETLATSLDAELSARMRLLETLAGSAALERRDASALRDEARRLLEREPSWQALALLDGSRPVLNVRHAADPAPPVLALPAASPASGSASVQDLPDGRIMLHAPAATDAEQRAALAGVLDAASFGPALARIALPPGWSAGLLDREGRLLAGHATLPVGAAALQAVLGQPGQLQTLGASEVLARPLEGTGWAVLVVAPRPPAPWSDPDWLAAALLGSAGFGLGGVLLAAWATQRRHEAARQSGAAEAVARAAEGERRRADLLATVSHELRAPLTGLLGYTELLLRADLPAQPRSWVEQQKRAGEVLLALIGDVLDLARIEDGAIQLEDADIDLPATLDEIAGMMRGLAALKGLALTVAADRGLPRWIKGDPLRLRQIVTNLLANAIKFTAAGEVTLAVRLAAAPDTLEITVSDTGPGIPPEELPRIFDRFRQAGPDTARRFGGSGLGLAICKRLATAMEGTIVAESRMGEGSRFTLRVPFRPGAAPAAPRRDGALRLLVAEDVPASRLLLKALLERAGHEVTAVEDGALALAAMHGASFDLGLIDLQMPELDGMGVAAAVRRMPGDSGRLPLIALTADPPEEIEATCRDAGFDAVLRKPFETRRLLGLIDALRGRRGEAAERFAAAG